MHDLELLQHFAKLLKLKVRKLWELIPALETLQG